jgi:hypothetical protein
VATTSLTLPTQRPFAIVGLYSPTPRSGKTTAAGHLAAQGFHHMSFATPLKGMLAWLLTQFIAGTDVERAQRIKHIMDNKEMPIIELPGEPSFRKLAQTLGTDWGRDMIHPQLWVEAALSGIARAKSRGAMGVVFDDIRFPNEANAIRAMGGFAIRIVRPDAPNVYRLHTSEGALAEYPFDAEVMNNGSEFALCQSMEIAVLTLIQKRATIDAQQQ